MINSWEKGAKIFLFFCAMPSSQYRSEISASNDWNLKSFFDLNVLFPFLVFVAMRGNSGIGRRSGPNQSGSPNPLSRVNDTREKKTNCLRERERTCVTRKQHGRHCVTSRTRAWNSSCEIGREKISLQRTLNDLRVDFRIQGEKKIPRKGPSDFLFRVFLRSLALQSYTKARLALTESIWG